MNNPTREEFDELKEEVRKLKQQQHTEPITIPRIELDPGGIQSRLDNHAELLKEVSTKQSEQEEQLTLIYTDVGHMKTDIGHLKGSVEVIKADVSVLRTDVERIEQKVNNGFQAIEKRFDAMAEVYKLILSRLPEKGE